MDLDDLGMLPDLSGISRLKTDPIQQQIATPTEANNSDILVIPSLFVPAKSSPSTRSTRRTKLKFPPNRIRRSGPEFCVECGIGYAATPISKQTEKKSKSTNLTKASVCCIKPYKKDVLSEQQDAAVSLHDIENKFSNELHFDDKQVEEAIESLDHPEIIKHLMHEMTALYDDEDEHSVFNEYKQQILDFFKSQIINYDGLKALSRKEFVDEVSSYCSDNGMRCKLSSLYDGMKKYYAATIEYESEDIDAILEELDEMDSNERSLDLWIRSIWIVGSLLEFSSNDIDADSWIVGRIERISDGQMLQIKEIDNRAAEAKHMNRNDEKSVRPLSKALPVYQYVYNNVHK